MDIVQFIGVPYKERGRDLTGCDCYGFVRLVLLKQGIALPLYDYAEQNPDTVAEELKAIKVDTPQDGDVVYVISRDRSGHIGVYYHGQVWEMTYHGVLSRPWKRIQRQVLGIYRPEGC